jgi:hypothetical protein
MQNPALSRNLRAQALVEFALVLPFLVLMLAGVVDLGNAFQTYIGLTNAAREGAHWGINHSGNICDHAGPRPASSSCGVYYGVNANGTCNTAVTTRPTTPGGPVCVTVSYTLNTLVGSVLGFGTIPINTSATLVVYTP